MPKPAKTVGYVVAYHPRTNTNRIGMVMDDGRCRIDVAGGEHLGEYRLYEATWVNSEDPWSGPAKIGREVTDLYDQDYT